MGLIREPLNVDFYCDGRQMTEDDHKRVSDFIKADKLKHSKKNLQKPTTQKSNLQTGQQAI